MTTFFCSRGHANPQENRFCRLCGEPLVQPTNQADVLAWRYRIIRELGHGGFGRTYLAEDSHRFNEWCVLKEFAPQVQGTQALQKASELFEREAGILYRLQHLQIPQFRELVRADLQGQARLFLVQDYVPGPTYHALMHDRYRQGQGFTEAEVTQLMVQLLPVLDYIHRLGVIHRDISPDNLIRRESDGLPVLIDYGGVKQVAAAVLSNVNPLPAANSGLVTRLGKAGYAPAEQISAGDVSSHSDLYALAVTVLVLMTGEDPKDLLPRKRWQRRLSLTPRLTSILERMLEANPRRRFQSAYEVMAALAGHEIAPPAHTAAIGTQVLASAAPSQRPSRWLTLSLLMVASGMAIAGSMIAVKDFLPRIERGEIKLPTFPQRSSPASDASDSIAPPPESDPGFSAAEQARKQQLNARRSELGISSPFLARLVNPTFYAQHPELNQRQLTRDSTDAALRQAWDEMALAWLNQLQGLSPAARSRLGEYRDADVSRRQAEVNRLRLSSRALNDLTNVRFAHIAAEEWQSSLLGQPVGQVWQAIAEDELKALQTNNLERIQFPSGSFSQQLQGQLEPHRGKALIGDFAKGQTLRLKLNASSNAVRLSFYPPTSQLPPLLERSQQTEWSGQLPDTGTYEVVIISSAGESVTYRLDLAAAEQVSGRE